MNVTSEQILNTLKLYVLETSLTFNGTINDIPTNVSLLQNGILDSYGMLEMIAFMENNWNIKINPSDFTIEKMGSIKKMSDLILHKAQNEKMS